jgi:hypothetical protein
MWPHKLASLLGFSSLPAVLLANCRFDIYAVGSDPIKQETCYDPNTPMASYEMALNTCTFVEKLPSNYRYKVIAAPDIKAGKLDRRVACCD